MTLEIFEETSAVSCHTGKVDTVDIPFPVEYRRVERLSTYFSLNGEEQTEFPGWNTTTRPYPNCGSVRFKIRCSDGEEAEYGRYYRNHCDSKDCPVCFPKWSYRQGRRAASRVHSGFCDDLPKYSGNPSNLYHVVFSAPPSWWSKPYREVIRKLVQVAKSAGLRGFGYVHHPARFVDKKGDAVGWKHCSLNRYAAEPVVESIAVLGPHIHCVGWGWLKPSDEVFEEHGVTYKKIRAGQILAEEDVQRIFTYLLTHTAVIPGKHAVRYGGVISYNKYQVVSVETVRELAMCPICGAHLERWCEAEQMWIPYSILVTRRHYKFKDGVLYS